MNAELEHIPTPELIEELKKRHDGMIIGLYRFRGKDLGNDRLITHTGPDVIVHGLLSILQSTILGSPFIIDSPEEEEEEST